MGLHAPTTYPSGHVLRPEGQPWVSAPRPTDCSSRVTLATLWGCLAGKHGPHGLPQLSGVTCRHPGSRLGLAALRGNETGKARWCSTELLFLQR